MPPNAPPFDPVQLFAQEQRVYERRGFDNIDFRVDEGEAPHIVGHASMFNQRYTLFEYDGWRYDELVAPGSFKRTIKSADVRALFNHDMNYVLGRTKSKTLTLAEDDRGLAYDILAPDTDTIRDLVLAPMKRGDITQSSFGFEVIADKIEHNRDEKWTLRTITEVKLWDVSPVTFPASPTTDAKVRSALVDAGFDLDLLTSTLLRRRAGMVLGGNDHEILRSAIEALQSAEAESDSEPSDDDGHHSDADGASEAERAHHALVAMQMRLRVLELARPA